MGEITLKSGKVVKVDVSGLTVGEWRNLASMRGTIKDENAAIEKCTGLTAKEVEALNYQGEFKPLMKEIYRAAQEPLADPNSQSASTQA